MSHVFLVTRPQGTPMLVAQSGLTIEPEVMSWKANTPYSGRSIIVYPSKERVTPGTVTVDQSFDHFVHNLERANILIRVNAIVEDIQRLATPKVDDPEEPMIFATFGSDTTTTTREQEVAKVVADAKKPARAMRKSKA